MDYNFRQIEEKWQKAWKSGNAFSVKEDQTKPKFYVLDMFPYPSGSGLHVGHPLGYIASDIYARYMRLKGYNVLHPMGFDAFGLPAEQYAIQTGQHPAVTTEQNIKRYKEQLEKIGFSYDWSREVRTCDSSYYKWTQWTFLRLFDHWYDVELNKARPIADLKSAFATKGNKGLQASHNCSVVFTADEWNAMDEAQQMEVLHGYRLAFLAETMVNWCPALGTVLANDEVKEGLSVRGGHPVEQKKMKQWCLRITAYAERLLSGLDTIQWTESLREMQRNWIGRSEGTNLFFQLKNFDKKLEIFTTRPDTIFGSTFIVMAPEHEWLDEITSPEYKEKVQAYIQETKSRTQRERMTETKKVTGQFTGCYAVNPFSGEDMPVWISDYVLAGYGTGAIMAVPGHDARDFVFAKHFGLKLRQVILPEGGQPSDPSSWEEAYEPKEGKCINSGFIDGLSVKEAIHTVIAKAEELKLGWGQVNYRLRDAIFSRQRYWGEPFPIYYKNGTAYPFSEDQLPLELPEVDKFLPTEDGQPPLGRAKNWKTKEGYPIEMSTMPGFAGSSGYYFRYMDPSNEQEYFSKKAVEYWKDVDLYIGGTEHATGHLIYARFWCKFLFDLGMVPVEEPFRKLINQGMIQGRSNFVYREAGTNRFISKDLISKYNTQEIHVDVNIVTNDMLDLDAFKAWRPEFANAEFVLSEDGKYYCGWAVEKMSKSMYNVVNPDAVVDKYGADTLRLYEMFLGPLEQSKPWDMNGIEGVHRFLRKFWRLFHDRDNNFVVQDDEPTLPELKALHKVIRKTSEDIESFSFNTTVSAFMICVNELAELKCAKRKILEPLVIAMSSFAPHICEELWAELGHKSFVCTADFPAWNEQYLTENNKDYPVQINGKMRFNLSLPLSLTPQEVEKAALADENTLKWLEGKTPKKVIVVPGKIINIVI